MQPFVPAKQLKQEYDVFGHFYSVELAHRFKRDVFLGTLVRGLKNDAWRHVV